MKLPFPRRSDPADDNTLQSLEAASSIGPQSVLPSGFEDSSFTNPPDRLPRGESTVFGLLTVRERHAPWRRVGPGVRMRRLYRPEDDESLRPGEPRQVLQLELEPGAQWRAVLLGAAHCNEWLVLQGHVSLDGVQLGPLDHQCRGPGTTPAVLQSVSGATLYVVDNGPQGIPPQTSRGDSPWEPFAPGLDRRVLWRHGAHLACLMRAQAGASAPPHGHLSDEQCFVLSGNVFAGGTLLHPGEFQLAQTGALHGVVRAESDLLVYLRCDAELAVHLAR